MIYSKEIKEIAEILKRSENAVYRKALALNLISKQWNEEKTIKLKELLGKHSIKEIAEIMDTSVSTINRKIKLIKNGEEIVRIEKIRPQKNNKKFNHNLKWSDQEINAIKILGEKYPCKIISDILQISEKEIYYICKKNNITIKEQYEYKKELIKGYIESKPDFLIEELEEIFGKSKRTIIRILKEIKIEYQNSKLWTEEQIDYLTEHWGYKSIHMISLKTDKSITAIRNKAKRLELGPMINNNDKLTVSVISEILNVNKNTVYNTWKNNGLNLRKIHLTSKKSYKITTIEDLYDFLKNNQDKWNSKDLELKIFGKEPEWLKLKRKLDFIGISNKPLSIDEITLLGNLIFKNTPLNEISNILKRSINEIIMILSKLTFNGDIRLFFSEEQIESLNKNNYLRLTKRNN